MKNLTASFAGAWRRFVSADGEAEHLSKLAVEKRRVETLRRLIGDIAHDLKTPLATIKVDLYLLRKTPPGPKTQDYLDRLEAEVNYLAELLDNLRIISRSDDTPIQFEFEPVDVSALIGGVIARQEPVAAQRHQTMEFTPGKDLPPVLADHVNLYRALLNVVTNAVCYTPEGGAIKVRTWKQEQWAVIAVEDTGIGIAPDDLPHIFERFYRATEAQSAKNGGSGLGLAIAKRVIEAHAGKIEVESTPGKGSVFRIWLPGVFYSPS